MAVYVDPSLWPFNGWKMCHMMADSPEELAEMAKRIKLNPRWIQKPGTWEEHYDISEGKRELAVKFGAVELNLHEMAKYLRRRREESEQQR